MDISKNIEVEIRGLLTKREYKQLTALLNQIALDKMKDDRKTTFFIVSGKTLKVTNQISQGSAKIALKTGDLTKVHGQTEYELTILPEQFDTAVELFRQLGYGNMIANSIQRRVNYCYKQSNVSIKWTSEWGYHYEIDKQVDSIQEIEVTREELLQIAQELGVRVMTDTEFEERCARIEATYAQHLPLHP